jgi:hypothetical protein
MSMLFYEDLYLRSKWRIDIPTNGYASTCNMFVFGIEHLSHIEDELE